MKNNNVDIKKLLVKTLSEEFSCVDDKSEQVILNLSTDFAIKNKLSVEGFFSENGQEFKVFFEKNYSAALNASNKDIALFWKKMAELV